MLLDSSFFPHTSQPYRLIVLLYHQSVTDYLRRIFICPAGSRHAFIKSRQFMAIDGTFLKGVFQQTLLACGVDANGQDILYAWSVVESENEESWRYFFRLLKNAIPGACTVTIMSDRDI